jgi:hypothetical protein
MAEMIGSRLKMNGFEQLMSMCKFVIVATVRVHGPVTEGLLVSALATLQQRHM